MSAPASFAVATALAPSELEAEIRAKAALLAGPRRAAAQLPHGGVLVLDDGSHHVIEPPMHVTVGQLSAFARGAPQPARNRAASSEPPVASPSL